MSELVAPRASIERWNRFETWGTVIAIPAIALLTVWSAHKGNDLMAGGMQAFLIQAVFHLSATWQGRREEISDIVPLAVLYCLVGIGVGCGASILVCAKIGIDLPWWYEFLTGMLYMWTFVIARSIFRARSRSKIVTPL